MMNDCSPADDVKRTIFEFEIFSVHHQKLGRFLQIFPSSNLHCLLDCNLGKINTHNIGSRLGQGKSVSPRTAAVLKYFLTLATFLDHILKERLTRLLQSVKVRETGPPPIAKDLVVEMLFS